MRVLYTQDGIVTGFNRQPIVDEFVLIIERKDLIYRMDLDFYEVVGDVFTPKTQVEVDAIKQQRADEEAAAKQREDDIAAAREDSGVRQYTVEQAEIFLDNKFDLTDLDAALTTLDSATDLANIKAAIINSFVELRKLVINSKAVHQKEIPYILD